MKTESDEQLIRRCIDGEQNAQADAKAKAFEQLVKRYQVLVCSIAYAFVGNVSTSEDIGQDAFLLAWKKVGELRDPKQFKSWLSTITRNEARAWLRRRANTMQTIEEPAQIPHSSDEEAIVDQDEADIVWNTLSHLPESYREPLVLYYRQDQSVAEVAGALSLSESATKQRLARGREMLRTEVMETVERGLRKTAPTAAFTVGVMALVSSSTKTAAAATGVTAAKIAATSAKTAVGGAASGSLIGLLGGFFGAWNSWRHAEYQSQREFIVRSSIFYLIGTAIFVAPFLAMQIGWRPVETFGIRGYQIAHAIWMIGFFAANLVWVFSSIRTYNQLQQRERDANTERLPLYREAEEKGLKHIGRRWTSKRMLLGLPLVQVAFPDRFVGVTPDQIKQQGTARGWIALGHFAHGRILAVGHRAIAPVAIGNMAFGFVSFGVGAFGLVSFGVLSVAPLALGVLCIGGVCLSGAIAVGVWAVGPMAFGIKAAKGAMAGALQFAVGPSAFAPNANNEAAREYIASAPMMHGYNEWMTSIAMAGNQSNFQYWIVGFVLVAVVAQRFFFAGSKS